MGWNHMMDGFKIKIYMLNIQGWIEMFQETCNKLWHYSKPSYGHDLQTVATC